MNTKELILSGHQSFADNIKLLLYKYDETIFDKLDFEEDEIYTDPLFFALLNNNEYKAFPEEHTKHLLASLVFGYSTNAEYKAQGDHIISDDSGRIYIPKRGWIELDEKNQIYLVRELEGKLHISLNDEPQTFSIIPPVFLAGSSIELLKYPHKLLEQFFPKEAYHEVGFTEKSEAHHRNLETALNIIRNQVPEHFELIEAVIDKLIIFDVDPKHINSFMSRSAYGAAFLNTYQDDYDEVFLLDDIAHQTGHVIFESLIYEREDFFNGDYLEIIETNEYEERTIEIFLHSLYTYRLILNCLDASLEQNIFEGKQLHEAKGRILHTLLKCGADLKTVDQERAKYFFTPEGMELYNLIADTYERLHKKWENLYKEFSLVGQPYNFTYSIFLEKNPIYQDSY